MNRTHIKRLRTLVQILREADAIPFFRKMFTMKKWGWHNGSEHDAPLCGTPACAMGHYASRSDVQRTFYLDYDGEVEVNNHIAIQETSDAICDHFGISDGEKSQLFGGHGCGGATRPKAAARYIERFADRKELKHGLA